MKKTDFPNKCSGCRLANRDKMRRELAGDNCELGIESTSRFSEKKKNGNTHNFKSMWEDLNTNFPELK